MKKIELDPIAEQFRERIIYGTKGCNNCKHYWSRLDKWCRKHEPYPYERGIPGMDTDNMEQCEQHEYGDWFKTRNDP